MQSGAVYWHHTATVAHLSMSGRLDTRQRFCRADMIKGVVESVLCGDTSFRIGASACGCCWLSKGLELRTFSRDLIMSLMLKAGYSFYV